MLRRRWTYVLLFALPAFLLACVAAAVVLGASAGVLWLFVFGDDPWPAVAGTMLGAVFVGVGAALWALLLAGAYAVGRQQESAPRLNTNHVAVAIGITAVVGGLVASRVAGVRFGGAQDDTIVCAERCRAEGFMASGMPPRDSGDRTCTCYDASGQAARRAPIP